MLPHAKRMQTLNGFQTESMPLSKQLHLWTAKVKWLDLSKKCSKTIKKGSSWTIGVKRAFFAFYFDEPPKNHFMNLQGQRPTSRGTTGCFQAVKADGILNTHRLRCQWWVHWIFDPTFRLSVFWTQSPWHPWVWQDWAVQSKSWSWRYGHQAILHISSHLLTSPHISSHLLTSPHISSHLLLVILPRSRSESAHGAHVCKAFLSLCLKDLERLFHTVPSYYSERILWVCAKLCTRLNLSGLGLSLAVETGRGWDPRRYQASEAARLPMMWCDFPKFGIFPRHFPIGVIPCGLALILQFFQQVFVGSAWSCLGKNWRVRTQPDGFKKNSFATHFHAFVWRSPTNPVTWASLTSMLGRTYRS